jgi:hypothetical protein
VADKEMGVIQKIRAPIDKALDWLVNFIVTGAKKLGKFVVQAGVPADPNERLKLATDAAIVAATRLGGGITRPLLQPLLSVIQVRYGLKEIDAFERDGAWWVRASINPELVRNMGITAVKAPAGASAASSLKPMAVVPITFDCNTLKYIQSVFDEQLTGHEAGLNAISVVDWESNRLEYLKSGRGSSATQEEVRELYRTQLRKQKKQPNQTKAELENLVEAEMERLAALHEPDLVAGGFNVISKLGSRYVNSSIGSQWRTKVLEIKKAVDKIPKSDKANRRINVKLTSRAFTP